MPSGSRRSSGHRQLGGQASVATVLWPGPAAGTVPRRHPCPCPASSGHRRPGPHSGAVVPRQRFTPRAAVQPGEVPAGERRGHRLGHQLVEVRHPTEPARTAPASATANPPEDSRRSRPQLAAWLPPVRSHTCGRSVHLAPCTAAVRGARPPATWGLRAGWQSSSLCFSGTTPPPGALVPAAVAARLSRLVLLDRAFSAEDHYAGGSSARRCVGRDGWQNAPMSISAERSPGARIVTALLRDGNQILLCHLCHRSPRRRWYPDVWDLPGGHVEPGELPGAALARELREELGIDIAAPTGPPMQELRADTFDMQIWLIEAWAGYPATPRRTNTMPSAWFTEDALGELCLAHDSYLGMFSKVFAANRA